MSIRCRNYAAVGHILAQQHHTATGSRGNCGALINADETAATEHRPAWVSKNTAIEKVGRQVKAAGGQRTHVDLRAIPKNNAVGIDEINMSIGFDVAGNCSGISVMNPVQRSPRAIALLVKRKCLAAGEV